MKLSLRLALGLGFFLGLGAQVWADDGRGFPRGGGGIPPVLTVPVSVTTPAFISTAPASTCAFAVSTEGAKTCFGPDTFAKENGTTIELTPGTSGYVDVTLGRIISRNNTGGFSFGATSSEYFAMTAGGSDPHVANGALLSYDSTNTSSGTAGSGTGYTVNQTGLLRTQVHKITLAETALTDGDGSEDETIWTFPAKTRILRIIMDVTTTFSGGGITDLDVICGPTAGTNTYLVTEDIDTAIGTYGDAAAEIGSALLSATVADVPTWAGGGTIVCRFTCAGAFCSACTQGSMTFYIEHVVYP